MNWLMPPDLPSSTDHSGSVGISLSKSALMIWEYGAHARACMFLSLLLLAWIGPAAAAYTACTLLLYSALRFCDTSLQI
jgi:hypothetical protein